jgi:hypothetical protein
MSLLLSFLKVSRQIFSLDTFGRQADEYITRGVMFFYVFYVFMFAYMDPLNLPLLLLSTLIATLQTPNYRLQTSLLTNTLTMTRIFCHPQLLHHLSPPSHC